MTHVGRSPSRLAIISLMVSAGCALATVPLVVVAYRHGTAETVVEWVFATFTPGFIVAGWWLLSRRPGIWIGRLTMVAGVSTAITGLAAASYRDRWPDLAWAYWTVSWMWLVHGSIISIVLVLCPLRRPRGSLDRWLIGVAAIGVTVAQMVTTALRPGFVVTTPDNMDGGPAQR